MAAQQWRRLLLLLLPPLLLLQPQKYVANAVHAAAPPPPPPAAAPIPSLGCGTRLREPTSTLNHHTIPVDDPLLFNKYRDYYVFVPEGSDNTKPLPIVYSFHGFYSSAVHMSAADWLMNKSRAEIAANRSGFIVVYGQGMGDCGRLNCYGEGTYPERSWNTWGQSESPGPRGHTCNQNRARWGRYSCYESCRVRANDPERTACFRNTSLNVSGYDHCHASTCANDTLYVDNMMNEVESALCVDRRRSYATGMSVGGMMAYWLAVHFTRRFAAALPVAGSALIGFWRPPTLPIPLMDIHGTLDTTIPANYSNGYASHKHSIPGAPGPASPPFRVPGCDDCAFSDDGFYYTPNQNITRDVAHVNGCTCSDSNSCVVTAWPTVKDDTDIGNAAKWSCFQSYGDCSIYPVIRCTWAGAHLIPGYGNYQNDAGIMIAEAEKKRFFADVAWEFFSSHWIHEGSEKERLLLA